jgi:hypothetical protein
MSTCGYSSRFQGCPGQQEPDKPVLSSSISQLLPLVKEFRHTFCRVLVCFPEDQPELKERDPSRRNAMSDILDVEIYELVIPKSTISIMDPSLHALS